MDTVKQFREGCNNHLLALLPDRQLQKMLAKLTVIELHYKDKVVKYREPVSYVYFPCDSISSIIVELEDGHAVEVGAVGNEGMTSVMAFLGGSTASESMICQVPGTAIRMSVEDFHEAVREDTAFRRICQDYLRVYVLNMAQSMACNRFHKIDQRLARWLLISHDRVRREDFPITQEFMALMLGTERPSVSAAAKILLDKGVIEYARGKMKVLDRAGLEACACECYAYTRSQYRTIMGLNIG